MSSYSSFILDDLSLQNVFKKSVYSHNLPRKNYFLAMPLEYIQFKNCKPVLSECV